jgi:MFS family permease
MPLIALDLDIPPDARTWPTNVFALITGAFLLPLGRLADMYGGYAVFNAGLLWFMVWSLVAGFSTGDSMLTAARALQGLGASAFLPSGIMLLGSTYRPGPRKNLIFGLYSAFAPLGFLIGIIVGGVTGEYLSWRWYFWLGAIFIFVTSVLSLITIPNDGPECRAAGVQMDWLGMMTTVPGLLLLTYAITNSAYASQGWASPHIYATCVAGALFLGVAFYAQGWISKHPLLPFSLFKPKSMKPLVFSLFFSYGTFGLFLFYASF